MDLNFVIFPNPKPTYTHDEKFGQLIYIPRDYREWAMTQPCVSSARVADLLAHRKEAEALGGCAGKCIPCLYLPCPSPAAKIMLYFHGNAEDVNLALELLYTVQEELQVHIVAMEYEGYGVYEGSAAAENVLRDCELLFYYVTDVVKCPPSDVVVFGRSIGSGPASHLGSRYPIHSLILMSAFTSLRAVARGFVGSLLQYTVAERFVNKSLMRDVKCPVFLIHGKKDRLVSFKQAEELYRELKEAKADVVLHMPEEMDHNSFDFKADFVSPLAEFYRRRGLMDDTSEGREIVLPIKVFNKPAKK